MKALGCLLIVLGAGAFCLFRESEEARLLAWGDAMLSDLSRLRREACAVRRPLPQILETALCPTPLTGRAWQALLLGLDEEGEMAWERFERAVPSCFAPALMPLGSHLATGGEDLARAIDETREELASHLHRERSERAQRTKLRCALSFSAAALVMLVLI